MILAAIIACISAGLMIFYFQATCELILRRHFRKNYSRDVIRENALAFAELQEQPELPQNCKNLEIALKCDFYTLAEKLKETGSGVLRIPPEQRLLMLYFRMFLLSLGIRQRIGLDKKPAIAKLTCILEHFSNLVGQRMAEARAVQTR